MSLMSSSRFRFLKWSVASFGVMISTSFSSCQNKVVVPIHELESKLCRILTNQGHDVVATKVIVDTLMFAELRNNNQGIVKLLAGALYPNPSSTDIKVMFESPVSCSLDGGQQIGMVVVKSAMDIAIAKAKVSGMCIVGCNNYSSATGALGVWAREIARQDLIGIVMSQCPEMVAPHGSYEPIFGTNPLAIGIPTRGRVQVLDMATSSSAWYGLVTAKEEGQMIPNDVAYDSEGHMTTDPAAAMAGALRVFDRNFKGSHLALMVELLAGALTGASMKDKHANKNWGSVIIAIDPKVLGPLEQFQENAEVMCARVSSAKRLPGHENTAIFLPGERGDLLEAENLAKGTIGMSQKLYDDLTALAAKSNT